MAGLPQTLGQYIATLVTQLNAIQRQLDELLPPDGDFVPGGDIDLKGHDILNADTISATHVVVPRATFSKIVPQTLAFPQTDTDLLVGLSPSSIITIPANSNAIGSVYRLGIAGTLTGNIGQSATINFGTVAGGVLMPFVLALPVNFAGVFFLMQINMTFNTMSTFNTDGIIHGYENPNILGGGFSLQNIPFDSTRDQTLTLTYTTADFTSIHFNEIMLQKLI